MTQDDITWGMDGTWNVGLKNNWKESDWKTELSSKSSKVICMSVYLKTLNFSLYCPKRLNFDKSMIFLDLSLIPCHRTSLQRSMDCLKDGTLEVLKAQTHSCWQKVVRAAQTIDGNCAIWLLRVLMPLTFMTSFERKYYKTLWDLDEA